MLAFLTGLKCWIQLIFLYLKKIKILSCQFFLSRKNDQNMLCSRGLPSFCYPLSKVGGCELEMFLCCRCTCFHAWVCQFNMTDMMCLSRSLFDSQSVIDRPRVCRTQFVGVLEWVGGDDMLYCTHSSMPKETHTQNKDIHLLSQRPWAFSLRMRVRQCLLEKNITIKHFINQNETARIFQALLTNQWIHPETKHIQMCCEIP